jgi:hypothetical protein
VAALGVTSQFCLWQPFPTKLERFAFAGQMLHPISELEGVLLLVIILPVFHKLVKPGCNLEAIFSFSEMKVKLFSQK